jgi:hypothetical protein
MGIPIGSSKEAHGGIYNFLLGPHWRLTDLYISDPYDTSKKEISKKKQLRYSIHWDTECNVQIVEMDLRSRRGSFSFILGGSAELYDNSDLKFLAANESEWAIDHIANHYFFEDKGRDKVINDIASKSDWLVLQPNIFGLGINLNAIIKDSITTFKRKILKDG